MHARIKATCIRLFAVGFKMKLIVAVSLATVLAVASGKSAEWTEPTRIVGGSTTTITQYPYSVAMLHNYGSGSNYWQACGGTILNQRSVLTAAHCFVANNGAVHNAGWWRGRVGSTWANSGGVVHNAANLIVHPNYNRWTYDCDVAILRTSSNIAYNNNVRAGSIAGANYNLGDNQVVWAIGWGLTSQNGSPSEQLRHVQIWTVNQAVCNQRYNGGITNNMLCSGWLNVGGRDQCQGDSGGPLLHNGVVVGVCSFGQGCALATHPGVNARVSALSNWISSNA